MPTKKATSAQKPLTVAQPNRDALTRMLAPFGVSMPNVNPNLLFPNTPGGFADNHPKWAAGIENALVGAATMQPSRTPGEAIGNVAQMLLGIPKIRQEHTNNQLMAPFALAEQIGKVQDIELNREYRQSLIDKNNSMQEWYDRRLTGGGAANFDNIQRGTDGKLYGFNTATGKLEPVPVGDGISDPALFGRPDTQGWQEEIIKANVGQRPVKQGHETDEQFQLRLQAWGKKAFDMSQQMATDPKVAAALAANNSRPVVVMTNGGPQYTTSGNAMRNNLPSAQGFVPDQIDQTAQMVGTGQIDLGSIKQAPLRAEVWKRLQSQGIASVPQEGRKFLSELDKIETIMGDVKAAYEKLQPKANASQFARGNVRKFMAKFQADPDTQALQSKIGLIGNIARGLSGEKGVLTDPDIQRAFALLPTEVTRKDVGKYLFDDIETLLAKSRQSVLGRYTKVYQTDGSSMMAPFGAAPTPQQSVNSTDPMGILR